MKIGCFLVLVFIISINAQLVTIPNGTIQGRIEYSKRGISFYSFQQIPYGKAARFQPPGPAEPWEGILNATSNTIVCYSQGLAEKPLIESEDCLVLNIYTPKPPSINNSLPVVYAMHGGGFVVGSGVFDVMGPHYWMEHDVIVVTINYRLGVLGFLSTEDTVIPGNYGLKDQQLGLRWVQENIRYFGGDPRRVTIFGESAGSASVAYQLLGKNSEGLFRGGIALSGSALSPWSYQRNARKYAYQVASFLNSSFDDSSTSEEIRELLLRSTPEQIRAASWKLPKIADEMMEGYIFSVVIEPEHDGAFLDEPMYVKIERGGASRVPLIIGMCSEESIWGAHDLVAFKAQLKTYDDNVTLFVNDNMHLTEESTRIEAGKAIRSVYTAGLIQDDIAHGVKFFSDNNFARGIIQHAKLQSRFSEVYFYQFSYYGKLPGWRPNVPGEFGTGRVNHIDDSYYVWVKNNESNLNDYPESDVITSRRYLTLFANFAKTMNPTSDFTDLLGIDDWPIVTPDDFNYLNINETLEMDKDLKNDTHPGLVAVYEKYALVPYDTF
ncbi:unnamed protein product [Phyllotreta striolata]|uniref:Carboxylic ester hydrolase n=1 Tax=Phyllotreta striolata TaxID=444603 RepID=A0A9N9TFJ5_PHYSR|nr:unnamed protein product [Phyllotreta striolata]